MTVRSLWPALLLFALIPAPAAQELAVLRITITIVDPDGRTRPVSRHALLISDNPASATSRRVVTTPEGTVEVRLRPGNYTVESDQPLVFQGRAYEWRQTMDVLPRGEAKLELTAANAEIVDTTKPSTMRTGEFSPSELLMQSQGSVVRIWTATTRGAGVVIDRRGLILTNQRIIGAATTAEVQLTSSRKVAAQVLSADRDRNVAVLRVDPAVVSSVNPAKLGFSQDGTAAVADGQEVFAIDLAVIDEKGLASGNVTSISPRTIASDIRIDDLSAGVPLLAASGNVIGITTPDDPGSAASDRWLQAVRLDEARPVIADAEKRLAAAPAPPGTLLPVELPRPFPEDALKAAAPMRVGSIATYQMTAADFDITFITPVLNYARRHPPDHTTGASKPGGVQDSTGMQRAQKLLEDFGNWSNYVDDIPPVLLIRATPKLVESFWTTVGRVAAQTQGIALPPFTHMKDSFSRMRLYCGDAEVTPIHPFTIERRLSGDNGLYEGLYVFEPAAISGRCGKVRLELFSEKSAGKADSRVVDGKIVDQIARDFTASGIVR